MTFDFTVTSQAAVGVEGDNLEDCVKDAVHLATGHRWPRTGKVECQGRAWRFTMERGRVSLTEETL